MIVLPHLVLALATVSGPTAGELFFARADKTFFAPEGTETLNFGNARLEVTPRVSLLRRPALAPVQLTARDGDVVVWGCADHACSIRDEVRVSAGKTVVVDMPVWSQSVHLRARADDQERHCCRGPDRVLNTVLVVGAPRRTAVLAPTTGRELGFEGVGALLRERPALLEATDVVLVLDESDAPDLGARETFVRRGGTWVTMREDPARPAVEVMSATTDGAGTWLELRGPMDVQQVAAVLHARLPALTTPPFSASNPGHHLVSHAASVALSRGPPAPLVLLVLLTAFIAAAVSMWRARRGDWRGALSRTAIVFAVAGGVMAMMKPLFVPSEVRTRLIVWLGPDGRTEFGVDAARPRAGTATVTLEAPAPVLGAVTFANRSEPTVVHLAENAPRVVVEASAEAGAGIVWTRPNPQAGALRVIDGTLENGLTEPLAFWVRDGGAFVGANVAPGARTDWRTLAPRLNPGESFARNGIAPHEERLLREVLDQCRLDGEYHCAAVLVRRAHETLAIEVRGW